MDKGRNAGIEGVVDIAGSPSFGVKILFWSESTSVAQVDDSGQGSAGLASTRSLLENGNAILRGKVRRDLFPFPSNLKDATGTVTFYLDKATTGSGAADVKMSASYRFNKVDFKFDEKSENLWDVTIGATRVSALTPAGFSSNGTQPTFAAAASGSTYLYAGRQKVTDPNVLLDRATQTFNVYGISTDTDAAEITALAGLVAQYATAPQTGLKLVTAVGHRLSNSVMRVVLHWALRDSKDDTLFPVTHGRRSAIQGYDDSVGSLVASSGALATQLNALWLNFTAESFCYALTLAPRTDGKRLAIYQYRNPGIEERISARGSHWVEARVNSGNVQVFIEENNAGGTGQRVLRFGRVKVSSRKVRRFTIRRNLNSPVVPEDSGSSINGVPLPDIGKTNGSTFQGIPAQQCIYDGPELTVHLGMPGITSFPMIAGWSFRSDSLGFFDNIPSGMFTHEWTLLTNYSQTGWTNVSSLPEPFASIVQSATGNFAAFTA